MIHKDPLVRSYIPPSSLRPLRLSLSKVHKVWLFASRKSILTWHIFMQLFDWSEPCHSLCLHCKEHSPMWDLITKAWCMMLQLNNICLKHGHKILAKKIDTTEVSVLDWFISLELYDVHFRSLSIFGYTGRSLISPPCITKLISHDPNLHLQLSWWTRSAIAQQLASIVLKLRQLWQMGTRSEFATSCFSS